MGLLGTAVGFVDQLLVEFGPSWKDVDMAKRYSEEFRRDVVADFKSLSVQRFQNIVE